MPRYLVKRTTWISHQGKLATEGETVDIDWPDGKEPKLGANLELVDAEKPAKAGKAAKTEKAAEGDLA